ncbi:MAG: ABC transporter permease [Candidatus Dormibacteria bacterium]
MSIHRIFATAIRVLRQLQHDPRTVGLILIVPCALLAIMKYIFQDNRPLFDSVAPLLLGLYPLVMMFLVTSVTTLRERTSGTLDCLMSMPLSKFDLMFGYALAFTVVAIVQEVLAGIVTLSVLQVPVQGSGVAIVGIATASAFLGTTLGLLVSAFASSEFQAVQFMPALLFPQILTCGLFVPRDQIATLL